MAVTSRAATGLGASWIAWITRAVARNRTTTIKIGMTVQASSIWVLPYTRAGSRCAAPALLRNFTTAYVNSAATARTIRAVMARTNRERLTIESAGVECGRKMLGTGLSVCGVAVHKLA